MVFFSIRLNNDFHSPSSPTPVTTIASDSASNADNVHFVTVCITVIIYLFIYFIWFNRNKTYGCTEGETEIDSPQTTPQ